MKKAPVLFFLFISFFVSGQNKPKWMSMSLVPSNSTYTFVPITVEASGIGVGRNESLQMLALDRGLVNSVSVSQKSIRTDDNRQIYNQGSLNENMETRTVRITTFDGMPIQLQAKIVDEYYDKRRKQFSTLYAVALTANPCFDEIRVTNHYGMSGFWRSAIVPGWGQIYKGSFIKGGVMMGGTAALTGGIIYTEGTRRNYVKLMNNTHDANVLRSYQNKYNLVTTTRNICIGAIAALYVWNVVDAMVAPGARYIQITPNGMGLSYNF